MDAANTGEFPAGMRFCHTLPYTLSVDLLAMPEAAVTVDARGLNCPMPLLKAKKALNEMSAGERLQVLATDPGSVRDFEVFSRQSGHALLTSAQEGDTYTYLLEKKAD